MLPELSGQDISAFHQCYMFAQATTWEKILTTTILSTLDKGYGFLYPSTHLSPQHSNSMRLSQILLKKENQHFKDHFDLFVTLKGQEQLHWGLHLNFYLKLPKWWSSLRRSQNAGDHVGIIGRYGWRYGWRYGIMLEGMDEHSSHILYSLNTTCYNYFPN